MTSIIDGNAQDEQLAKGPWYTLPAPAVEPSVFEVRPQSPGCTSTCSPISDFVFMRYALQLLPEANLRQLLSLLPLSERIRSAELVSKQWRTALLDQQILSVLDFSQDELWRRQVTSATVQCAACSNCSSCCTHSMVEWCCMCPQLFLTSKCLQDSKCHQDTVVLCLIMCRSAQSCLIS